MLRPSRVMIVDDAVVVRGLLARWIGNDPAFVVVGIAANGRLALDMLDEAQPDIVLLDLDMPEMDGMTALPMLLRRAPSAAVVIASTLTRRNAELSLKCLALGAADCISKPDGNRGVTTSQSFRSELLSKLAAIADSRRRRADAQRRPASAAERAPELRRRAADAAGAPYAAAVPRPTELHVPHRPTVMPRCLLIGASTGGPRAVAEVLTRAGAALERLPVLVVQHMPPIFTAVFAEHLRSHTGRPAREAFDGEPLLAGTIYVAPGGRHMRIVRTERGAAARISDEPPVNFCRPAVDLLFQDAAAVFGASALGLVLTGMGSDGLEGARALTAAGASIIVQDEATSAVWGMPGAIAKAGLAREVMSLPAIGAYVAACLGGPA